MFKVSNKDARTTSRSAVSVFLFKHEHFFAGVSLLYKCGCLVGNVSLNLKMELQSLRKPIYHSF